MPEAAETRESDQIPGIPLPEETSDVYGHANQRASLHAAFTAGRLAQAYLLHGPRGIGKATFAYDLARWLIAETSDESPDRVAAQIAQGSHPNVATLRIGTNPKTGKFRTEVTVEDVRDAIHFFQVSAGRAGRRVMIVDAIDDLNRNAANALLKTLEEPPAQSLFFLVSHRPGSLLPTIRSRCQVLAFRPLADADLRAAVRAAAPEADVEEALAHAAGRPRRALEALLVSGTGAIGSLRDWLQSAAVRTGVDHLRIAAELAKSGEGDPYPLAITMIGDWIAGSARANAQDPAASDRLASLIALWDKARGLAREQAIYNLDRRQTLVMMMDAIRAVDASV